MNKLTAFKFPFECEHLIIGDKLIGTKLISTEQIIHFIHAQKDFLSSLSTDKGLGGAGAFPNRER